MLDLLFYVLLLSIGVVWGLSCALALFSPKNLPSRKQLLLFSALFSYLFFFLAALSQGWEFPATVLDVRSGSPAGSASFLVGQNILRAGNPQKLKYLIAEALANQGKNIDLEIRGKIIPWELGEVPKGHLRQSANDISRLFLGIDFFSRRPITSKESFLFFNHQGFELRPRSLFVSVGGEPVSSVADFKLALSKMPGNRAFPVQLSVGGVLREAVANFQQKPFFSKLPDLEKRLDYFGLVDWGFPLRGELEQISFVEGFSTKDLVLLSALGKRVNLATGLPDLNEGNTLVLRLPLQGAKEVALNSSQAGIIKSHGIRLEPELAFPLQFSTTVSPFLSPLQEWRLRLERGLFSWQISGILGSYSQVPWRKEEIEFTFWQSFSFWFAILGNIFFLLFFYFLATNLFPKYLQVPLLKFFPLLCLLYHFHELFVFRALR